VKDAMISYIKHAQICSWNVPLLREKVKVYWWRGKWERL